MNILDLMKNQHHMAFDFLMHLEANSEKSDLADFQHLKRELESHFHEEEKHLYSLMKLVPETAAWVQDSIDEHNQMRRYLRELSRLSITDPHWQANLTALQDMFTHHTKIEEKVIYEKLQALGPDVLNRAAEAIT